MPQFVLMLRDTGSFPTGISPEEIQQIIERYAAWSAKLGAHGQKLRDGEGRVMTRAADTLSVVDGPYAEAREILGGYFVVDAADFDEAVKLAADCPHLDFGSIEVRQIEM